MRIVTQVANDKVEVEEASPPPDSKILTQTLILLWFTVYSTILKFSTALLSCTSIQGSKYMSIDTSYSCYTWPWIIGFLILLFATGFSFGFLLLFRRRQNGGWRFDLVEVLKGPYSERFAYWEVILIFQRFCMGMVSEFLSPFPFLRSSFIVILVGIFILLHVQFAPFKDPSIHTAHYISLGCLFLMALFSLRQAAASSFASSIPNDTTNERVNNVIIVLNAIALCLPITIGAVLWILSKCQKKGSSCRLL